MKVARCLQSWKGDLFSLGGRLILINVCLFSIPLDYLFLFRIPAGTAEKIEARMRNFLWAGGKMSVDTTRLDGREA